MNASSALSSQASMSSLCNFPAINQQQPMPVSKPKANSTVTFLPAPITSSVTPDSVFSSSQYPADSSVSPTISPIDGYSTPKSKLENQNQEMPSPSPMSAMGKRKRLDMDDNLSSFVTPTSTKRKASGDFLRKGQWTSTEERLTRLLIEAFEEGSLPIYTGIRLRGYLAVQLQCDPMRVSKKLCAGTIDGKQVPKNYGQKKFKLRKKSFWDSDEVESQIAELERLTKALWSEAQMRKPTFLTLSSTCNSNKKRGSPPVPTKNRFPSSTPKSKKQKVFPIIYLNLSKLKRYSARDDSSNSGPTSPSKDSDSDSEPVKLDRESLQAAYDLLTLCSPRGSSSKGSSRKGKFKASIERGENTFSKAESNADKQIENNPNLANNSDDKLSVDSSNEDFRSSTAKFEKDKPTEGESNEDKSSKKISIGGNSSCFDQQKKLITEAC